MTKMSKGSRAPRAARTPQVSKTSTGSTTVHLRPPENRRSRAKHKSAKHEAQDAFFRYRVQLTPFIGTLWLILIAHLAAHTWVQHIVPLVYLSAAGAVLRWGARVRLSRPVERWYAAALCLVTAAWHTWATWGGGAPGWRASVAALLGTGICAAPWWHHRRARGSIAVRMDGMAKYAQADRLSQAQGLINDWTGFTSAARLHGAKLQAITFDEWSMVLAISMRRGGTVQEFTALRLAILESAFGDVRPGSARVEKVDANARLAMVRFMIQDPHEHPIKPPETGQTDFERVILGMFETGEKVLFNLVNTLIGGMTGSGKSGVVNVLIRALARMPQVAILGIDMKPGAPELGKWRSIMHSLATDPQEVAEMLDALLEGLKYRGDEMSRQGIRVWKPTPQQPFIVLIVDEVQELKAAHQDKKLNRITGMIRAYGGCVIVATQYPTKNNVSPTIKENCPQTIGLSTDSATADRVIFGESATREGWRPSGIRTNRKGSFYIKSPSNERPLLARAYWLDDEDIDREVARLEAEGGRTLIDHNTWPQIRSDDPARGQSAEVINITRPQIGSGEGVSLIKLSGDGPTEQFHAVDPRDYEVVDAEIVDDDPALRIEEAIGKGYHRPIDIGKHLDMSRATVYRHLKKLAEQNRVVNEGSSQAARWVLPSQASGD